MFTELKYKIADRLFNNELCHELFPTKTEAEDD